MAEPAPKVWSTIDVVKIGAGSLAAVSAAVAASSFGVAGTLGGAALASVIGSVGTELYTHSLHRGYKRLRTLRPGMLGVPVPDSVVAAPGAPDAAATTPHPVNGVDPDQPTVALPTTRFPAAGQTAAGQTAAGHTAAGHTAADGGRAPRWKRVLAVCAVIFVLAMLIITAIELAAGRSLAGLFGDRNAGTTTIGTTVGDKPRRTPAVPAPLPSGEVTSTPTTTQPTQAPSAGTQPTSAPATGGPASVPPPTSAPTGRGPGAGDLAPSGS
jgi:hypothetical protein